MNTSPLVAIVGRPNVGKSSLFNRILNERIAIEENVEGVTRDRLIVPMRLAGRSMQIMDTGGIGVVDRQSLEHLVEEQIDYAIAGADQIIFLVDGSASVTELDRHVAKRLHKTGMPVLFVANKVDHEGLEANLGEYMALGFGEPKAISILHSRGFEAFTAALLECLPEERDPLKAEEASLRIALSGRRNVGKSSLTNLLCQKNRVIVSDVAGTTRDSIDVDLEWKGRKLTIVDTAGLRKKHQTEDSVEFFSMTRTYGAMVRAQMVFFMVDAEQGVSIVDRKLADWIVEHGKPCIIVVNKWDLAEHVEFEEYEKYLWHHMPGLTYAPIAYISVHKAKGMDRLFKLVDELLRQMHVSHSTGELNRVLEKAVERRAPPQGKGKPPKLQYMIRLDKDVPTYLIFGKRLKEMSDNYKRYLSNFFRTQLDHSFLPVRFVFRENKKKDIERV